ncbi:MAG: multidrug efflux RND transporter permease subunit [Planctomycetes bacterium]|nr:multidrug efflux RND transporter permease subunit [Planctomycetota bacterium]
MRFPHYFIDRPIFAGVLSILIVLLGGLSMLRLPVSEYPEVVPPTLDIRATYPGADPETVAATVAGPLEQQMTGLDNLLYMLSQSTGDGGMSLTLTFKIGTDLNRVLVDVQNRIQQATPRLPEEVRRLGVIAHRRGDMLMVVHLLSPDDTFDTLTLVNYAKLYVRDRLAAIPGVGDAVVFGAGDYSMRIWLDPDRLTARGLQPGDVERAIREQNVQVAAGTLAQPPVAGSPALQLQVTTRGRLTDVAEFENIIVRRGAEGQLVRLRDVARIELGGNTYALRSLLDNKPAAAIPIFQAPGTNAIATSTAVRAEMAKLQETLPKGMTYAIVYDPTTFVRASIDEVVVTLLEAIALVVLVVIVFLQTWRASIIPLIAVPVSLIGTFAAMHLFGFSINSLSLFGLVLAIGIVVDDAIVVVENAERNIADGLDPRAATKQAMREVSGPILATALVLASVFIPTAFISGLTGRFYQQFALTIAFSTIISAFNSLTLSPALCALLLKRHEKDHRPGGMLLGWFFRGFNRVFGAGARGYVSVARRAIRLSALMLILYLGLLVLTGYTFTKTPSAFIPGQDKGFVVSIVILPDGTSLGRTEAAVRQMTDIALKHPAVEHVVAFPGMSPSFAANSAFCIAFITLKHYDQRPGPENASPAVAGMLSGQFQGIPDALCFALQPPPVLGLGLGGGFELYLQDRGNLGLTALNGIAQQVVGAMHQSKLLAQGRSLYTMNVPRVVVDIDRDKLEAQHVALRDVFDALQGYFGSSYVNDFNRFNRTWQVTVQADAQFRMGLASIERIKIRNAAGGMVPLSSFVTVRDTSGPSQVNGYNTFPSIDLSGAPAMGVSGDQAQAEMVAILERVLPRGVGYEWTGLTYQQILAGNTVIYIFPICVLLVLLVLAAFYESLTLPLAIILIVPMCLLSALVGVHLGDSDNNIMTQIGLIVLVGLACKNAILIVEFAKDAEVLKGMDPIAAAIEACRLRLRPILMTSIAFIMGVSPLLTGFGAGAELRRATGLAVFSGMIGVTIFGLLLTPVFYVVLRRVSRNRPFKRHDHDE